MTHASRTPPRRRRHKAWAITAGQCRSGLRRATLAAVAAAAAIAVVGLAACAAAPSATPQAAGQPTRVTGASPRVFTDDFERGRPVGWTRVTGPAAVKRGLGYRAGFGLVTSTAATPAYLTRRFAQSRRVTVAMMLRRSGGGQTLVRFPRSGLSLVDDGLGRMFLAGPGTFVRLGRFVAATGWHAMVFTIDVASATASLSADGVPVARVPARALPESAVQIGDVGRESGGPYYLDNLRITHLPGRVPLDLLPPSLELVGPPLPDPVSSSAALEALTSDRSGIARVEFLVDTVVRESIANPPYRWTLDPASLATGQHLLTVRSFDRHGNAGKIELPFRVADPLRVVPPAFFSPRGVWNAPLPADVPLAPDSAVLVEELLRQVRAAGTWLNTTSYSAPVITVPADQSTVRVTLDAGLPALQQALDRVPLPAEARPAAGLDAQLVVWQPSTDTMWEFWQLQRLPDGWHAAHGGRMTAVSADTGIFPSPPGWGATGTGLPLVGGMVTLAELRAGRIDHALAMAIPDTRARWWAWPAQRTDGNLDAPNAIPEGTRFRLDPTLNLDLLNLPPVTRMLAEAAQRYGIVVRDRAGAVVFYAEDPTPTGWDPYPQLFRSPSANTVTAPFPWEHLQVVRGLLRTW
jgi:Big-like domain-containing protein